MIFTSFCPFGSFLIFLKIFKQVRFFRIWGIFLLLSGAFPVIAKNPSPAQNRAD
jgi:hypothetical protein